MPPNEQLMLIEVIERQIYLIRGQKVMVDRDLAALYACKLGFSTRQSAATCGVSRRISCFK